MICSAPAPTCSCSGCAVTPKWKMRRGDTRDIDVTVKLPPYEGADPVPVDITGWTLWFTAKFYVSDPDIRAPIALSTAAGITITTAAAGKARVTIPAIATVGFPDLPVDLQADLQGKDPGGKIHTIETETGVLRVTPDVTRATT